MHKVVRRGALRFESSAEISMGGQRGGTDQGKSYEPSTTSMSEQVATDTRASSGRKQVSPRWLGITLAALLCVLISPDLAWAWGPATHVGLGSSILNNLALLPASVALLLGRQRMAYLYGSIAADIVFAKRLSRVKQFCHHWSTAFRLLDTAKVEKEEAFALGYFSHLAADTVAHNKFVPHQIALSRTTVNFGHFYWEMRADAAETRSTQALFRRVVQQDHTDHHNVLACHISGTFLSYGLNRALFNRMNAMVAHRGLRRTMGTWDKLSRWHLSPELLQSYREESIDRIRDVLSNLRASPILREDPNGTAALMQLHVRMREARRLRRRGVPISRRLREASHAFSPSVRPSDRGQRLHPVLTKD